MKSDETNKREHKAEPNAGPELRSTAWLDAQMRNCAEDDHVRRLWVAQTAAESQESMERRYRENAPLMANIYKSSLNEEAEKKPAPSLWARLKRKLGI